MSARRVFSFGLLLGACFLLLKVTTSDALVSSGIGDAPAIIGLLKPQVYKKVVEDRSVQSYASLDSVEGDHSEPPLKRYHFYAAMISRATLSHTRAILTDYKLYAKLVPYIDQADYDQKTHLLSLSGGIWKWKLYSTVRFEERSQGWIHFNIVAGHFNGLAGDILFERAPPGPHSEEGTLVFMRGEQVGSYWPPSFIIEQGAEIVFGFTANRMRSYIEADQDKKDGQEDDVNSNAKQQIPQPRSHL